MKSLELRWQRLTPWSQGETDRKIRRQIRSLSRQIGDDSSLKKDLKMQLEGIAETI